MNTHLSSDAQKKKYLISAGALESDFWKSSLFFYNSKGFHRKSQSTLADEQTKAETVCAPHTPDGKEYENTEKHNL